ncbi:MAG TPA: SLBB domain-containing protein [Planctomycetota bacterium]|jgi:polysaccharide export outer membrane protein|nr:SLBB domain-containing protein [Planctomycetota bacterium]
MRTLLAVLLLPAFVAGCAATDESGPRKSPAEPTLPVLATPVVADPLVVPVKTVPRPDPLLLAGDLLTITVFRQPDLLLEVRIPQDGRITFPLIGAVEAASHTQAELETTIRTKLEKDYIREASVTVTVKEYAKRRVYIVGGVMKPDGYEVSPNSRVTVLQAIAAAGGFTDKAYKEFVQIVRRRSGADREVIKLSLVEVEKQIAKGQPEADLELWPDDLIVIPSAVRVAYVLGAVNKPGNIDVPNDARVTVSMAVSAAGSYTKFASTGRVQVLRRLPSGDIKKLSVDLDAVLAGDLNLDVQLLPGDVVWVPERGIF